MLLLGLTYSTPASVVLWACCCCCATTTATGTSWPSAFTTLPASSLALSYSWNTVDYESVDSTTVQLFAGNNKGAKKKKTKKSSRAGGNNNVSIGGGEGFGSSTRTAKKPKAQQAHLDDPETARLTAIYTDQFKREQEQLEKLPFIARQHKPSRLVQISQSPLIFTIDEFINPEACARVQFNGAGCFDLDFPRLVSDRLFNGQESELDGLLFNQASSRDHDEATSPLSAFPDGIHMDTNNECMFRHVTAILYLNDVPAECGGATVFPLARTLPNDPALAASRRLLAEKISHTSSRVCGVVGLEADAQLLETRVGTNFLRNPATETAIRIQPKAGRLLLFFSRCAYNNNNNGEEDPRAWHAGERLRARDPVAAVDGSDRLSESESLITEKRILTLFKQVDYATDYEPFEAESTFEAYLAPQIREQQKWLQAQAQL